MQLLGILTVIIPIVFNARLAKMAWFYAWILAGASIICAIVAIPLYLYTPTKWAGVLSYMATVAQVFVTLQLVFVL